MVDVIDEEGGVSDLLLLAEFAQEQHGELSCLCLKQPCVEDLIHVEIDSGVRLVPFVVDPNYRFVHWI